jgi:hypothetical protein
MANTYTLIASNTVGSGGAASVTFSSIPSSYTDLCLKYSIRNTSTNTTVVVLFNGSSANLTRKYLVGSGTAVNNGSDAGNYFGYGCVSTDTASTFASNELYIPNYASSNYKSMSVENTTENNSTTAYAYMAASLLSSTSAISSMDFSIYGGNLAQYSTLTLYGIKNS